MIDADTLGVANVLVSSRTEKNVLAYGEMGKKRAFLGDVTDASVLRPQVNSSCRGKELSAVDLDLARRDVA